MTPRVPEIEADWALFLDFDGTLIDIAPTPDSVIVPDGLTGTLAALAAGLDGAVAIASGRPRSTIDRLLAPLALPGGFGHGSDLRDAAGRDIGGAIAAPPAAWAESLCAFAQAHPGLLLECKPNGLTLHYRAAPQHRDAVRAALEQVLQGHGDAFELLAAHMAFEIRPRGITKARAVEALMAHPPFAGRRPVFVGDDVTDEDGMEAARRMGGLGLHVGRDFTAGPSQVRDWLARAARRLRPGAHDGQT